MDNELNDLLSGFLSRPDSMEKLQGVLTSLGGAPAEEAPKEEAAPATLPALPDMGALQKLMPMLGAMSGGDDQHVALLRALRPYMQNGREKRVDEAIEMLRLAKLLPLLKQ